MKFEIEGIKKVMESNKMEIADMKKHQRELQEQVGTLREECKPRWKKEE